VKVHQVGPVLAAGDAVTNQILEIDRCLAQWGLAHAVYGANIDGAPPHAGIQPDSAYAPFVDATDDLLIYHYSAYCENYELFLRSRNRKILVYHNITPAEFYRPYDAGYHTLCLQGRALLPKLAACDLALGDSEYNRSELVESGFAPEKTGVLPLLLTVNDFEQAPIRKALHRQIRETGGPVILFVGRVAPNKGFEELLKLFAAYHCVDARARLYLVGARFLPLYDERLDTLVARLGLVGAVTFTNRVPMTDLRTYYEAADLFLCASQHEGFCAPLLEAMYFDVPILARAAAGVSDTLGPAGVLYHTCDTPVVAEMMHLLISDTALRRQMVACQRNRLAQFAPARVQAILRTMLETVIGPIPTLR
jgi:glycosyltransferase involved in cell wall biosynthesis